MMHMCCHFLYFSGKRKCVHVCMHAIYFSVHNCTLFSCVQNYFTFIVSTVRKFVLCLVQGVLVHVFSMSSSFLVVNN